MKKQITLTIEEWEILLGGLQTFVSGWETSPELEEVLDKLQKKIR
jgi:hypothetical protein